ncbi:unnamed protein product [Protopolystoma xenopodis]|uniref:Uncharacterized protein n=1 Tax=Protopolystoma xenopodis TaxID=117903 RepID=A0A3S5AYF5_9PLAT|nr:unnamed protein product [Protopolystoma xenopodis]
MRVQATGAPVRLTVWRSGRFGKPTGYSDWPSQLPSGGGARAYAPLTAAWQAQRPLGHVWQPLSRSIGLRPDVPIVCACVQHAGGQADTRRARADRRTRWRRVSQGRATCASGYVSPADQPTSRRPRVPTRARSSDRLLRGEAKRTRLGHYLRLFRLRPLKADWLARPNVSACVHAHFCASVCIAAGVQPMASELDGD